MRRYNFDRPGKAQGVAVHANSLNEAIVKARDVWTRNDNPLHPMTDTERRERTTELLVFRDNQPCVSHCSICCPTAIRKEAGE